MKKTTDGRRIFVELRDADGDLIAVVQAGANETRCWIYGEPYLTPKQARKLAKGLIRFADWADKKNA